MRQTNACLNRVFKFNINFMLNLYPGAHANLCAYKKVYDENRKKATKKDKKTGTSYKLIREM